MRAFEKNALCFFLKNEGANKKEIHRFYRHIIYLFAAKKLVNTPQSLIMHGTRLQKLQFRKKKKKRPPETRGLAKSKVLKKKREGVLRAHKKAPSRKKRAHFQNKKTRGQRPQFRRQIFARPQSIYAYPPRDFVTLKLPYETAFFNVS